MVDAAGYPVESIAMRILSALLAASLALAFSAGCEKNGKEPQVAPSSDESGYAEKYPEQLERTRTKASEKGNQTTDDVGKFESYPDELQEPEWKHVDKTVEKADQAGRSQAYVQVMEDNEKIRDFMEREKDEISKRAAGATGYAAKQNGCSNPNAVSGACTAAFEKSIDETLKKRLQAANDAHRYIDDHEEQIKKKNVPKLRDQVDTISHSSYQTNIGLPKEEQKLASYINEASAVKSTLNRTIDEADKVEQDPDASDTEKEQAKKRRQAAEEALGRIDADVEAAKEDLKRLQEQTKELKQRYQQSLKDLRQKLKDNEKNAPPPADEPPK